MGLKTEFYMGDSNFSSVDGIVSLYPSEGTHGIA